LPKVTRLPPSCTAPPAAVGGAFRPKALRLPIQGRHLQYHWDGSRISRYFGCAEERWVVMEPGC
jgi:hypothetical protein